MHDASLTRAVYSRNDNDTSAIHHHAHGTRRVQLSSFGAHLFYEERAFDEYIQAISC